MEESPRKLTENEIQDILNVLPNIKSVVDNVSKENSKSMKVLLREQLKDIEITPLGISDLKDEIIRQFHETIIQPGTMVGVTASESLGKPITQMALNSFHTSGAAKNVSTGIQRITELINASLNPKKTSCSIYFKDQFLSFEDIITKKRPEITEITVKDLVVGMPDIENAKDIVEPYWYSYYRTLVRDDFDSKDVLRLTIDPNILYAYKLTMENVCSVIENGQPVVCVYSPISEGKIDIYPNEKMIISKLKKMKIDVISTENASLIFLSMIIIPALDKLKISGISGIQQIYPVEAPVWQIVKEEIPSDDFENGWFLILNPVRMKATGITVDKLIRLSEVVGMKVLKVRPNYIAVSSIVPPTKLVNETISKDLDDEKEYEKKKKEEGARIIRRPPTEISIHSKLIYSDSTGANLKELFMHPDIDSTRTYSNNVHEIRETLGIEAARTFLIKEFIYVIGNEGYINPRHIVLLVDFMTSLGNVYGVTSTGVSRQPIGALEKASFEKAMKHFKEAAVFGEEKEVSGTSASIFVGKRALIGTGYSSNYIQPENLERYNETRKQLNTAPDEIALDIGAFNDAIESFNIESSADIAFLSTEAEQEMFGVKETKEIQPSEISEIVPPEMGLIKGKLVRSSELEEAANMLRTAPCLRPVKPESHKITTLEEVPLKPLPPSLLEEMERIAESGKPSIPLGLPPLGLPPLGLPLGLPLANISKTVPKKSVTAFDLDDFLK